MYNQYEREVHATEERGTACGVQLPPLLSSTTRSVNPAQYSVGSVSRSRHFRAMQNAIIPPPRSMTRLCTDREVSQETLRDLPIVVASSPPLPLHSSTSSLESIINATSSARADREIVSALPVAQSIVKVGRTLHEWGVPGPLSHGKVISLGGIDQGLNRSGRTPLLRIDFTRSLANTVSLTRSLPGRTKS